MNKTIVLLVVAIIFLISCKNNNDNTANIESDIITDSIVTIESISQRIRQTPQNADLFLQRADLNYLDGNIKEAINDSEIALRIDSLRPDIYIKLSEYYLIDAQSEAAKNILVECLTIFPRNAEARLKLAYIYFYIQTYIDAMKEINVLEANNLQNSESYYLKALIYDETEMYQDAITALRKAIEYDNSNWKAYNLIGLIYGSLDDNLAVEYFTTAIRLFPNNLEIRYNAGVIFQKFGLIEEAENSYKYVINSDSTAYSAYLNLGILYVNDLKDYDNAIKNFTKAIEVDSLSYNAYYNRGYTYEQLKNYKQAEQDYRQSLKILPNFELAVEGLNDVIDKQY